MHAHFAVTYTVHRPIIIIFYFFLLLLLLISYTNYIISINKKDKQKKEKQKSIKQLRSLYAQMFYSRTDVIIDDSKTL